MVLWFFQRRSELDPTMDTLVPLGTELPTFEKFKERCLQAGIMISDGFEQSYFDPCVAALKRLGDEPEGWNHWPYCGFKMEGGIMCAIQGWGPKSYS